ncbi:unnamed protein product, partial [Prorocentrum cordatum]
ERAKNAASVESTEDLVKSCQKEILAMKVFQSDMDDAVANNMAFLGGAIQIAQWISEPQLRDAIAHELGTPRGSIHKAHRVKAPTGIPLNAKILRPHLSDPISVASSPGGAAAPRGDLSAETGGKKKNNEKFEIFIVDYDRMPLIGQSGATTAECKLAPGPDGARTAKVHGDDKETEVPNAMYETWSERKTK